MTILANRYGKALFEAATAQDAVDVIGSDLSALAGALANEELRAVVLEPDTPQTVRRAALDKCVASAHQLTKNLVSVLMERRRLPILPELNGVYRDLVMASRGEVEGVVETPYPLSDEHMRSLEELALRLAGKKVQLSQKTSPDLIGGVRLRVENTLYDSSVATALDDLRQQLLNAQVG